MATIDTVEGRSKLTPREAPYWKKEGSGKHIGFRKLSNSTDGTWHARGYDKDTRKQPRRSLGSFSNLPPNKRYDAAKAEATKWWATLDMGGSNKPTTVKEACEQYVSRVRIDKDEAKAKDLEARFRRLVYTDKIANIELRDLNGKHLTEWRNKMSAAPAVVNPYAADGDQVKRPRAKATVNRDMASLRAALNHALESGEVTSDAAWRVSLKTIKNANRRRNVYLDKPQRLALVAEAPTDVAALLRAASLLPLRIGALAALTVADYDRRLCTLKIPTDKAGAGRSLKLPPATAEFFAAQCEGKTPGAYLLPRTDGKKMTKDYWKAPVKAAAAAVGLPGGAVAYSLRHAAITDLVVGGLDLMTVSQISGTSIKMIQENYGHLQQEHAAAALAKLAG